MKAETKRFWQAVTTLIGSIIGVGIFGIPYAISRIGAVPAIAYFLVLGGIQMLQHLFFAEAAIACPDKVRLPGLVGRYLGPRAKWIAGAANIFGLWAGLVAYIIVGGEFLSVLLKPFIGGQVYQYQIGWALAASVVVFFGLGFVSRIGVVTVSALLAAFALIFVRALPSAHLANLVPFHVVDPLLPYGVLLFSLSGLPAILEMEDVLEGKHEHFRKAVIVGTLAGAAISIAFGYVVFSVTGLATTEDSVTGLRSVLGEGIAVLAALFGFLAIMNCFLRIGTNLRNTFRYDFKLSWFTSWLATVGLPFGVYLISIKSFTAIISFSGSVFGGITAIIVALLYVAVAKKKLVEKINEKPLGIPSYWAYGSIVVLALGAALQIVRSAAKLFN